MKKDLQYRKQRRNTQRRLKGKEIRGKRIAKVGSPIDKRLNCPTLVPVGFSDGTFGVLWEEASRQFLVSDNSKVNKAIKNSAKMPLVGAGIAGDVLHLNTFPKKKNIAFAFIKVYYNEKAGGGDIYREVSEEEANSTDVA